MLDRLGPVLDAVSGITPKAWVVIGPGFVREEFKTLCFQTGKSIIASAVQNPRQIAQELVPQSQNRVLERFARIQLLKECVKNQDLKQALPRILEHRFRPRFFEALDRTLQQGRSLFSNASEAQVFEARLNEKKGHDEKREEFFLLNRFWERLLEVRELWDEARVFEDATESIRAGRSSFPVPKLFWLEHSDPTPRVRFFQESLSAVVQFEKISVWRSEQRRPLRLETVHSLEDVAHFILDELLSDEHRENHAVVIEDRPEVRRTIKRVAIERGYDLMDPRDPTQLHQSEEVKSALIELELAAKDFPRELVIAYWAMVERQPGEGRKQIIEQGVVSQLENYSKIPAVFIRLSQIREQYPSRLNLEQLSSACLKSLLNLRLEPALPVLQRVFDSMKKDAALLGTIAHKKPLRWWLSEVQTRLKESTPLTVPQKNKFGLRLFRVDQAVSLTFGPSTRIHFMGVSPTFFESHEDGTEWFTAQDMEVLAKDFSLPSREHRVLQAKNSFLSWVHASKTTPTFYESMYGEQGDELDTSALILSSFSELNVETPESDTKRAHPALLPSMTGRLSRARTVDRLSLNSTEFPMSFLNAYGNCPFTAMAGNLLSLKDERDPDFDLDPDIYGTLIHKAIEILLTSKGALDPKQSFREAWNRVKLLGWVKSERMYRSFERNAIQLLEKFLESEKEFREYSRSEPLLFESPVELVREGIKFKGRIDRVDRHSDGLVVIDYKTSSRVPSARETLEKGKGLQMPLYALALKDAQKGEVVSAQYLTLKPEKTSRNTGFLFKAWNKGSKKDEVELPLSKVRSNSGSLLLEDPEQVWGQMDERIKILVAQIKDGQFGAQPADPKDCPQCRYSRVCGVNRGMVPLKAGEEC